MARTRRKTKAEASMDVDNTLATETNIVSTNEHIEAGATLGNFDIDTPANQAVVFEASTGSIDAQATTQGSGSKSVNAFPSDSSPESESVATAPNDIINTDAEQTQQPPVVPEQTVDDEEEGELQYPVGPPSPVPTEPVPEPPRVVVPFETTIEPGIVARDFAFSTTPIRPPLIIFPIYTTYIWFLYNRHRVIKRKPRILLNGMQSAFVGCDLVYLIHYNWVEMKDISWMDARDWLGWGLLYLYEHPRDTEITYGARRPSAKSPKVTKYFSQFTASKTIKENTHSGVKAKANANFERRELRGHGPFGEAIFRFFNYEEHVVLRPLFEYLCGRAPRPMMSELMERVFGPILNCHGGGVGGRGVPYERPRAKDDAGPREGTEVDEVDIDPDLFTIETSKVAAFAILNKERARAEEKELLRQLREAEEELRMAEAAAVRKHRKRGNGWTRKKAHKGAANATTKGPLKGEERAYEEERPTRRFTRSAAKAADQSEAARKVEATSQKNKGKGKAKALPSSDKATTGAKRGREEEDTAEDIEQAPSDPGPSRRQARRIRRKVEPPAEVELLTVEARVDQDIVREPRRGREDTSKKEPPPRGVKRSRSVASEPSEGSTDAFRKRRRLAEAGTSTQIATPTRVTVDEPEPADSVQEAVAEADATNPEQNASAPTASMTIENTVVEASHFVTVADGIVPTVQSETVVADVKEPEQRPPLQISPPPQPNALRRHETTMFYGEIVRPKR